MEKREYPDISHQNKEKIHKVRKSKVERKEIEYFNYPLLTSNYPPKWPFQYKKVLGGFLYMICSEAINLKLGG